VPPRGPPSGRPFRQCRRTFAWPRHGGDRGEPRLFIRPRRRVTERLHAYRRSAEPEGRQHRNATVPECRLRTLRGEKSAAIASPWLRGCLYANRLRMRFPVSCSNRARQQQISAPVVDHFQRSLDPVAPNEHFEEGRKPSACRIRGHVRPFARLPEGPAGFRAAPVSWNGQYSIATEDRVAAAHRHLQRFFLKVTDAASGRNLGSDPFHALVRNPELVRQGSAGWSVPRPPSADRQTRSCPRQATNPRTAAGDRPRPDGPITKLSSDGERELVLRRGFVPLRDGSAPRRVINTRRGQKSLERPPKKKRAKLARGGVAPTVRVHPNWAYGRCNRCGGVLSELDRRNLLAVARNEFAGGRAACGAAAATDGNQRHLGGHHLTQRAAEAPSLKVRRSASNNK
jgi:hypothetical protein